MNRAFSIAIWVFVIVSSAFGLYRVKYEVQAIHAQIEETRRELAQEKETLRVAAAEWAYLNRPERLRMLAGKYISDDELTVSQVAEMKAIPFPTQMQAAVLP